MCWDRIAEAGYLLFPRHLTRMCLERLLACDRHRGYEGISLDYEL